MKIIETKAAPNPRRVRVFLAEKGITVPYEEIDIMKGAQKGADHLARHPFGVVPVFEDDDGFVLYESRAILRYLDAKLEGVQVSPKSLQDRALMEQWISVEQSYFSPPAMKAILEVFFAPMKGTTPDADVIAKGKAEASKALDVIERGLVGKDFLVGDFSLADITYAPYLQYLFDTKAGDIIAERPNVSAWASRILERPSWRKALGKS